MAVALSLRVNPLELTGSFALKMGGKPTQFGVDEEEAGLLLVRTLGHGLNPVTGDITFLERKLDGTGGVDGINGLQGMTVSPDGQDVYIDVPLGTVVAVASTREVLGELLQELQSLTPDSGVTP